MLASIGMSCGRVRFGVDCGRFVTKDTIEQDILERAKRKMILEYASEFPASDPNMTDDISHQPDGYDRSPHQRTHCT
jgi:hypothetical protein